MTEKLSQNLTIIISYSIYKAFTQLHFVSMFSYVLTISVSERLPKDQAALARTLGERSSSAARMLFAASATNITS